jgi:diguanylate cyclase (GGDEF)-like protein/PAS domain S-box-containing protein
MKRLTIFLSVLAIAFTAFFSPLNPVQAENGEPDFASLFEDITEEESKKRIENKISLRNEILVDVLTRDFSSAHEQLDYVLSQALRLTGSQFGYIYLYDEQNKEFLLNTWSSDVMDECRITKKQTIYQLEKTGLWGETVRQSRPIIDNDFEMPGEMKKGYPDGHVKIKRFMTVPVIIEGAVVAVVGLANKQAPYDDDDTNQTTILMSGVWNALERREGREQLQLILNSTAEGIYGLDKDMKCTFINAAGLKLLGYNTQEELLGRNMHDVIHHSWPDGSKMPVEDCQIWRSFMNGQGGSNDNEVFWKKDGSSFYSAYFSYPQVHEEAIIGGVVTFMDNTQRRANEEKIRFLSYRDPLTNLYNRRFFEEELKRVDVKINLPISIIMGDLNGLKMINDIFGHSAGDEFLKKAASAIRKACREADVVARVGGDEFAIVVTNTDAAGTQKIIERIKSALARQHINAIKSSISLGYATKEEPDQSLEQIVKLAGVAMFKDKSLNREKIDSEMLHTVIQILHDRFPHEKEHSEKMSRLCEEIGKKMKLSSAEIRKLRNAGYLHDIGKVVLSPEWLEPGAILDVEAQKEIENHPVVSFRILNLFDKTMEIAEIALNHHEYLDGSGYPNKISGEEIPLLSRILSVAEDFLTMTDYMGENSPQREKALETIKNLSGIKYDPDVVEALSEVA